MTCRWAWCAVLVVTVRVVVDGAVQTADPPAAAPSGRQIVDQGIILHRCSYLRDFWNVMDALVVVCAAIQAAFDLTSVPDQ